jgi:alpha-glucosidase
MHVAVHHDGSPRYVRIPDARQGLCLGDEAVIRIRTDQRSPIRNIFLRTTPDGEQQFSEMKPLPAAAGCRWWTVSLRVTMPVVAYRFLILTDGGALWYTQSGLCRHTPTDCDDFKLLAGYASPSWVTESVFYQIFIDRFADGDPLSNVRDGEFSAYGQRSRSLRWEELPSPDRSAAGYEFYGGDLPGIGQHLDDLCDLGVNALYLTPIFTAFSNHRYDVADYFAVDPHLGGNEGLVSLRQATARRGMRLILDIVPNHCGSEHPWFKAAQADPGAPEGEYFIFQRHPDEYSSWLGHRSLPKLNYQSPRLRDIMYRGPEAVFRHWLRPPYAVDGWRIDVSNMLGRHGGDQMGSELAREIRKAVKEENPEAYLLGENFFDGTWQLQGDAWDATMNYPGFSHPLWSWLGTYRLRQHYKPASVTSGLPYPTQALLDTWAAFRAPIPWTIARQQFNLLSSHDTDRILTAVGGDPVLNRLAAVLLLTAVGVPSIYYGDEIGISGEGSAARRSMPWDKRIWDNNLRNFYRMLVRLRLTSRALVEGGFQVLESGEDVLSYLRDTDDEQVIIVANRGPNARPASALSLEGAGIADGVRFTEVSGGEQAAVRDAHLRLPELPPGGTIWRTGG